jgi:hypothetical protein
MISRRYKAEKERKVKEKQARYISLFTVVVDDGGGAVFPLSFFVYYRCALYALLEHSYSTENESASTCFLNEQRRFDFSFHVCMGVPGDLGEINSSTMMN